MQLIRLLFGLRAPVTRKAYLFAGFALMLVKFAIERLIFASIGARLGPVEFLTPFFVHRLTLLQGHPDTALLAAASALPFLWVGLSMSTRRAADAGLPPVLGFAFLVPGVHYVLIALLSILPTKEARAAAALGPYREAGSSDGTGPEDEDADSDPRSSERSQPPVAAAIVPESRPTYAGWAPVLSASGVGLLMVFLNVYGFRSYGSGLFLATPFVMGFVAATSFAGGGKVQPRTTGIAIAYSIASLFIVAIALIMFAKEGGVCLLMAAVPAAVVAILGAALGVAVGRSIDQGRTARSRQMGALLLLPLASGAGAGVEQPRELRVTTEVVVDAPPGVVWQNVVTFPELDPPTEALFRNGVAYPIRARIDGEGVGAVRYCEFSTGAFVEPITTWDEPRRLAFDVAENPAPMKEWNPFWDNVDAPHLHGFMSSKRGEFRLTRIDDNHTRLEGTTVYQLEIYPNAYWQMWSDEIVHAIHHRVLDHIKRLSEGMAR